MSISATISHEASIPRWKAGRTLKTELGLGARANSLPAPSPATKSCEFVRSTCCLHTSPAVRSHHDNIFLSSSSSPSLPPSSLPLLPALSA
eukprot:368846-Hanusia_phi.AAC.6